MSNLVQNPFPIFTDSNGNPLEDGFIFIGIAGLSPISNPLQAYWDAELTIPANDIRTKGGYPANSGTPGRIYTGVNYSIVVQDKRGATLYTQNNAIDFFSGAAEVAVQGVAGEVISVNDSVYFAADGLLYIADSSDITKSIIAGVSVADVLSGAFVTAQRAGILSTFSGLVVGESYYLSASGAAVLKTALIAGDEIVFIGVAITLSSIDLNIHAPENSDVIISAVLGETIAAGIPVYYASSGKLLTASKDDVTKSFVVGIALESGDLDEVIRYKKVGITSGVTGLTAGTQYYLGDAGAIVVVASVTGLDSAVSLGVAISATAIDVNIQSVVAGQIRTEIIEIGDWDMSGGGSNFVQITHGISDFNKIRNVTAMIRLDDNSSMRKLDIDTGVASSGYYVIGTTQVSLFRVAGSTFDDALYDATSFNRGWLTIVYEV